MWPFSVSVESSKLSERKWVRSWNRIVFKSMNYLIILSFFSRGLLLNNETIHIFAWNRTVLLDNTFTLRYRKTFIWKTSVDFTQKNRLFLNNANQLTHLMALVPFYTPESIKKSRFFWIFSGGRKKILSIEKLLSNYFVRL